MNDHDSPTWADMEFGLLNRLTKAQLIQEVGRARQELFDLQVKLTSQAARNDNVIAIHRDHTATLSKLNHTISVLKELIHDAMVN